MAGKQNQTKNSTVRPLWIQIYFVLAALIGLILIVIGGVSLSQLALNSVLGVKDYPEFSAPFPYKDPTLVRPNDDGVTPDQKASLEKWHQEYQSYQEQLKSYNATDQNRRRRIAESLAMIVVGVPVFALHAPHIFKKG